MPHVNPVLLGQGESQINTFGHDLIDELRKKKQKKMNSGDKSMWIYLTILTEFFCSFDFFSMVNSWKEVQTEEEPSSDFEVPGKGDS